MIVVFIVVEGKRMDYKNNALQRIRSVADYQFGRGVGEKLFPDNVNIQLSKATGRIRYVNLDGERLATLRPTDGFLSLGITAAQRLKKFSSSLPCFITVRSDIAEFVAKGGDVFAAHIVKVDERVHAKNEVIVTDETGGVIAVGRALLAGPEMLAFKTGVAVKVRHGSERKK